MFRLTGVIRADTLAEMFDLAAALGSQPLPRGRRVGIVTNAGGPAILCADACEAGGLVLPEFSAQTQSRLRSDLPAAASVANPVDMIASAGPDQYARVVETALSAAEIDALIVIYIPVGLCETDAVIAAIRAGVANARAAAAGKPVLACLMTEEGDWSHFDGGEQVPSYAFPEAAARVLGKMAGYADWRSRPEGMISDFDDLDLPTARAVCRKALEERGSGWLSADESRTVLAAVRLPVPPGGVATIADDAVAIAERVGFPVAVKLASRQLVHKTEVGGVCLNLADANAVRQAFQTIRDRGRRAISLTQWTASSFSR